MNPKLSDPIEINGRHFRNRAVLAPMVPNCAGRDGRVTNAYKSFFLARAQVGYLILGAAYVHPEGKGFDRQLGIYDDMLIPGLTDLFQSLQPFTNVGIQISFKSMGRLPDVFEPREIQTIRESFSGSARRAAECGFTAIELHACHDYWLNYFLSPHFNHRADEYGGCLENRFRLLKEVVQSIRAEIGEAILLGVRLSMDEFVEDGLTLEETLQIGRWLEQLGVDYISASGGIGQTQYRMSPPMDVNRGSLLHLPQALKHKISIPIIGVGRLDRPGVFNQAIDDGYADFAAVARALLADPQYALKVLDKRENEIRPCIACNFCLLCLHRNEPVRCAVNPYIGNDLLQIQPLKKPIKVMVVGGGPAGLSAAAISAARGARVKLFEKNQELGGVINLGMKPPFKEPLKDLVGYLVKTAVDHGVDIQTGVNISSDDIKQEAPDQVIIATGATSLQPEIQGIHSHDQVYTTLEALDCKHKPPGKYLIVGGGAGGLELAEFLAAEGVEITILEMTETLGKGLHSTRLQLMLERIENSGIKVFTLARLIEMQGKNVKVETTGGVISLGPFDFIIFATGYKSNKQLASEVNRNQAVSVIGDAVLPRTLFEAIKEGFDAALDLN